MKAWICKYMCLILASLLVACSSSAGEEEEECPIRYLKDIAYTQNKKVDNLVYLYENGKLIPYLVLDDSYEDGESALLLRQYVLDEIRNMNDGNSYYPDSQMDVFLNEEFLETVDIKEQICTTSIAVTTLYFDQEPERIARKVFLLSAVETGNYSKYAMRKEGEALEYFKIMENRDAYREAGTKHTWWTRTRDISYTVCTYVQGREGYIGSGDCKHCHNSVRPAFCLPQDTPIMEQMHEGEMVYVIAEREESGIED